ncbi:MAG: minichromosome maintenance protein MCM [Candidatus Aenigmarchaeota archaeon]|nr:minichromosome maintenance protein MCM [Candidatus Aenigmarchaeota archaeon]
MDIKARFEEFLKSNYYNELLKLCQEGKTSLVIDFSLLDRFDPLIADQLLEEPEKTFEEFQEAVKNIDLPEYTEINIRVKNLPERRNIRIRNLRSKHIDKLYCIDGIVKSASEVKPQIYSTVYKCPDCGALIEVEQVGKILRKPNFCECGRKSGFDLVEKKMVDIRWLRINEPFEITTGERPGEIAVFLKGDLTTPEMQRKTDPGNRIKIVGVVKELPIKIGGKEATKRDIYIDVNYVEPSDIEYEELEITPEDEKKIKEFASDPMIFEKLMHSIAPTIYGFDEIKEAIVLQMFGGVPHQMPDGTRVRGNIHILITGDPGTGKSQILKLVSDVIPRGKYVSGKGVTGAGLTASVRKEEELTGGWVLEAGALVLANKGLISIDEFDKMNKDDQIAMHEAMSLETISIAKASITATLPSQTAVLAAANPKFGRFDPMQPIVKQIDIPQTLMSRFDLKFALRDKPDRAKDRELAEHILTSRMSPETTIPTIPVPFLRKYLAYAKMKCTKIRLTEEASKVLRDFYVDMRNRYAGEETATVPITLRQYEALIRMAEASAKVRLSDHVTVEDAQRAIKIMKFSLRQLGYEPETGRIDIDRIESGITTSQRNKIRAVLEIIDSLHEEGRGVSIEDIKAEASEKHGMSDSDVLEIIDRLKRDGTVFEPRSGYIRKV